MFKKVYCKYTGVLIMASELFQGQRLEYRHPIWDCPLASVIDMIETSGKSKPKLNPLEMYLASVSLLERLGLIKFTAAIEWSNNFYVNSNLDWHILKFLRLYAQDVKQWKQSIKGLPKYRVDQANKACGVSFARYMRNLTFAYDTINMSAKLPNAYSDSEIDFLTNLESAAAKGNVSVGLRRDIIEELRPKVSTDELTAIERVLTKQAKYSLDELNRMADWCSAQTGTDEMLTIYRIIYQEVNKQIKAVTSSEVYMSLFHDGDDLDFTDQDDNESYYDDNEGDYERDIERLNKRPCASVTEDELPKEETATQSPLDLLDSMSGKFKLKKVYK